MMGNYPAAFICRADEQKGNTQSCWVICPGGRQRQCLRLPRQQLFSAPSRKACLTLYFEYASIRYKTGA